MQIYVTREISKTSREWWSFHFCSDWHGGKFVLDSYKQETRKSTHHAAKWNYDYFNCYSRVNRSHLKLEDVLLPEDVKVEAKKLLLETIDEIPVTV